MKALSNRNMKNFPSGHSRWLLYTECCDFGLLFCREQLRNIESFIIDVQSHFSASLSLFLPHSHRHCSRLRLLKVPNINLLSDGTQLTWLIKY